MRAEEVAMFLTSNPYLLNKSENWAWRQAGISPLRRSVPVSGMNKPAEGRKHVSSGEGETVQRDGIWMRMGYT